MTAESLGGAHVWTLDMDDFSGSFCSEGPYPLVNHLRMSMGTFSSSLLLSLSMFFFNHLIYRLIFFSCCPHMKVSLQSQPLHHDPQPPGIPLPVFASAVLMGCTRMQLIRPPTSSVSRETLTSTTVSLVSSTGIPASAATGPKPDNHPQEMMTSH